MKFLKKSKKIFMALIIGILSAYLLWYTLRLCRCLMNSDTAYIIDYVELMFKYKSLFPKTWVNTNDFWVYSLIPQLALFMKLGINMFLSRQLSVIVQNIALFATILYFFKTINIKKGVFEFFVLIMSGVSAQFMFEMYGDGTYATIILFILLAIILFIKYLKTNKIGYAIGLFVLITLLCSCSLRFPILLAAPLIFCLIYFAYTNRKIKKDYVISFIAIVLGVIIGYCIYKYLLEVLMINSYVERPTIDDSNNFANAIYNTVFDYLFMSGSTGKANHTLGASLHRFINSSSPSILITFVKMIFAIFVLVVPFKLKKKIDKLTKEEQITYVFVSSSSLLLLFFLIIGDMHWFRYHVTFVFFLMLLLPIYYKYFVESDKLKKGISSGVVALISICSMILVFDSTIDFEKYEIKENEYQGLVDFLVSKELYFGFNARDNEHNIYHLLSDGKIRIARLNRTLDMPYYWLNSTDWFQKDYYKGNVFFINNISKSDLPFPAVEEKALMVYHYDDYNIYVLENSSVVLDQLKSTYYAPARNWKQFRDEDDLAKKRSLRSLFEKAE